MGPENLNLGELYAIPEVGEPVKIEGLKTIKLTMTCDEDSITNECIFIPSLRLSDIVPININTIKWKFLTRCARRSRRYMRRHKQQEKRRRNAMKTNMN